MIDDAAPGSYSLLSSVRPPVDCNWGPVSGLLSQTDWHADIKVLLAHLETFQDSNQSAAEEVRETLDRPTLFKCGVV